MPVPESVLDRHLHSLRLRGHSEGSVYARRRAVLRMAGLVAVPLLEATPGRLRRLLRRGRGRRRRGAARARAAAGGGRVSRLAAWWRYRRALARLVSARLDLGYGLSPELYRRLQRQARNQPFT